MAGDAVAEMSKPLIIGTGTDHKVDLMAGLEAGVQPDASR